MRSSSALSFSAALVLLTGSAAFAGPADDLSRAAVSGLSGLQIAGATVGEARDEGSGAVLSNVAYASAGTRPVSVGIARVTVIASSIGPGDMLTNARVVLEGVKGVGSDSQSYQTDRVEIAGAQGSLAAILGSLATREPFFQGASEASVTGFSAQSIDVPAMTLQRRRDARMEEAAYRGIRLTDYRQGKIAEMTIAGIAIRPQEGAGQGAEIGPCRFAGFDASAGTRSGSMATVAVESGSIEQIRGTSAERAPFSIERISFGRVAMRPGERSLVALTEAMQDIDPAASSEESRRRSAGVAAEMFSRLDIERIEMTNFSGRTRENQPVALARFMISGVSQGRIATIEFGGLNASAQNGQRTTIARLSLEDIDVTGLIALGREFSTGSLAPGKPIPHSAYPDIRRLIAEAIDVTDGTGQRLGKLERFEVEAGPRIGLVPTRLRARLTGFEAPVNDPRQRAQLAPIGVTDKINLGAEVELEYVEGSRELRMRTLNVDVDDVGSLNLGMTIGGVDRAQIEALPGSAAILGLSAKAGPLTLTFTENGGVESFISHLAGQTGMDEDQFRQQLKHQAAMMIGRYVQDGDLARRVTTAFGTFLDDPNSLAISATPRSDIPLAALAVALRSSPLAALPMFDIDIRANR